MKNVTLLILVLSTRLLFAQETASPPQKNTIYVELLGNAKYYSVNYDRIVWADGGCRASARIGINYLPQQSGSVGVPLEINGMAGKTRHFAEVGLGTSFFYGDDKLIHRANPPSEDDRYENYFSIHLTGRVGYRFQKPDGGLFLRVGYTPLYQLSSGLSDVRNQWKNPRDRLLHWFGLGIGHTLK